MNTTNKTAHYFEHRETKYVIISPNKSPNAFGTWTFDVKNKEEAAKIALEHSATPSNF